MKKFNKKVICLILVLFFALIPFTLVGCNPNNSQQLQSYRISASANYFNRGSVYGGGWYYEEQSVCLFANPAEGYEFVKWNDDDTHNPRYVRASQNITLTAIFETKAPSPDSIVYTVEATPYWPRAGTVYGVGDYHNGETIFLYAAANDGYEFAYWSDGNTQNPREVLVNQDISLRVAFNEVEEIQPTEYACVEYIGLNFEGLTATSSVAICEDFIVTIDGTTTYRLYESGVFETGDDYNTFIGLREESSFLRNPAIKFVIDQDSTDRVELKIKVSNTGTILDNYDWVTLTPHDSLYFHGSRDRFIFDCLSLGQVTLYFYSSIISIVENN